MKRKTRFAVQQYFNDEGVVEVCLNHQAMVDLMSVMAEAIHRMRAGDDCISMQFLTAKDKQFSPALSFVKAMRATTMIACSPCKAPIHMYCPNPDLEERRLDKLREILEDR